MMVTRCVLDSGSQCNFISHELVQKLCLPLRRIQLPTQVCGIGDMSVKVSNFVMADISSRNSGFSAKIKMFVLPSIMQKLPVQDVDTSGWGILEQTDLADPTFCKSGSVDLIVGAELFFQILRPGRIKLGNECPLLQNTQLGWVVSGCCSHSSASHTAGYLLQMKGRPHPPNRVNRQATCALDSGTLLKVSTLPKTYCNPDSGRRLNHSNRQFAPRYRAWRPAHQKTTKVQYFSNPAPHHGGRFVQKQQANSIIFVATPAESAKMKAAAVTEGGSSNKATSRPPEAEASGHR